MKAAATTRFPQEVGGFASGETDQPRRKVPEILLFEGPLTERLEPTGGQVCPCSQRTVHLLFSTSPCSRSRQPGVAGQRRKALNKKDRSKASGRKEVEETQ